MTVRNSVCIEAVYYFGITKQAMRTTDRCEISGCAKSDRLLGAGDGSRQGQQGRDAAPVRAVDQIEALDLDVRPRLFHCSE